MDVLSVFILAVYAFFVSFLEERFGRFQDLPSNVKQLINSVLTFIVPAVANYLNPIWQPEFGDANEVVWAFSLLIVPAIVWLISQIAHAIDRKWIA
jgi:hypothetical protein